MCFACHRILPTVFVQLLAVGKPRITCGTLLALEVRLDGDLLAVVCYVFDDVSALEIGKDLCEGGYAR